MGYIPRKITIEDRIEFLMAELSTALNELEYVRNYDITKKMTATDHPAFQNFIMNNRSPNPTVIIQSLKNVSRCSSILAHDISKDSQIKDACTCSK